MDFQQERRLGRRILFQETGGTTNQPWPPVSNRIRLNFYLIQARDTFHTDMPWPHKQGHVLTDSGQEGGPQKTESKGRRGGRSTRENTEELSKGQILSLPSSQFRPPYPQRRLVLVECEWRLGNWGRSQAWK